MIAKSAEKYCRQGELHLIENYADAASSPEMWECHHRLEITINGEYALGYMDLRRLGMFYHRPHYELIFLPRNVHKQIHWNAARPGRRIHMSECAAESWRKTYTARAKKLSVFNSEKANSPEYREKLKQATLAVMSDPEKKRVFLEAQAEKKAAYAAYKGEGGTLKWNAWARDVYAYRDGSQKDTRRKRKIWYENLNQEIK
ncbi:MAG: hypothetical protein K5651_07180 [Bacteroidales bacterium]|nr:hypothetical protein [Bacteroidales bacterium]